MDERVERIGRNEALFRRVNEQIEALNRTFAAVSRQMTIVCECGHDVCVEQIEMTTDEYEQLRADPTLFAVKPGHEIPDTEQVVARNERYWTASKHEGPAAELARETDPRT
jgi:hypothetical protein